MNADQIIKILEAAAEEAGIDVEMDQEYTGRSMYQSTTLGVVCETPGDFLKLISYAAFMIGREGKDHAADLIDWAAKRRSDNLGQQVVYY